MHTHVDEGAEGGNVGHRAFELHAELEVGDLLDTVSERRRLELGTRVAAGLLQLPPGYRSRSECRTLRRRNRQDADPCRKTAVADDRLERRLVASEIFSTTG